MYRTLRIASILLAVLLVNACSPLGAQAAPELTGDHVASITRMFLRNHFSRIGFDDAHSDEMMTRYLSRFDPGHYYFLRGDIAEFRRYSNSLDDRIRRGRIDTAFLIYERFLDRMKEREKYIAEALEKGFDLTKDETFLLDRENAPYPVDEEDARRLFRKKLKMEMLELTLRGQSQEQAADSLRKRYRSQHFRFKLYTHNDVVTAYINAFTSAYDPHSAYMSPDDLENFNISMRLSLEGIGATLRLDDGYTVISSIIPGGAAARQGDLQPEDRIVAVAEGESGAMEDVTNQRLIDVVKLIRGPRGTTVRLTFLRKGTGLVEKRHEVAIVRDKIHLTEGEATARIIERAGPGRARAYRIGVIKLPSFYVDFAQRSANPANYKSAARDVEKLLKGFISDRVDGVVLDLRSNGGGGLDEAVKLAGLFLKSGPVVLVKDVRGRINPYHNPHSRPVYRGHLTVLVNRYSASASEIVAGALQDYGRAVVVGDRATFGKGTVQNIITLQRGLGGLKTTVAKFYRPGSSSTQNRGVEPDIVLPSLNNHLDIGESALENALPWDTVQRASFKPWSELDAIIPVLRERSRLRVSADDYFRRVEREVQEYVRSKKDRKAVTLRQLVEESEQTNRDAKEAAQGGTGPAAVGKEAATKVDPTLGETLNVLDDQIQLQRQQWYHPVVRVVSGLSINLQLADPLAWKVLFDLFSNPSDYPRHQPHRRHA